MKVTWLLLASVVLLGVAIAIGRLIVESPGGGAAEAPGSGAIAAPPRHTDEPKRRIEAARDPSPVAPEARERPSSPAPAPAPAVAADWKARWAAVPLDPTGRSLGADPDGRNRATLFNRAVGRVARGELSRCKDSAQLVDPLRTDVELFVESIPTGYSIVGAQLPNDAGVGENTRRCIELAFEQHLDVADAGMTPGQLFRLSFPILMYPPGPPDSGD